MHKYISQQNLFTNLHSYVCARFREATSHKQVKQPQRKRNNQFNASSKENKTNRKIYLRMVPPTAGFVL